MMRSSFVKVAADCDFPIQNLPFGIFSCPVNPAKRVGIAIGSHVLDLDACHRQSLLPGIAAHVSATFLQPSLNPFMELGRPHWRSVRQAVTDLLDQEMPTLRTLKLQDSLGSETAFLERRLLVPQSQVLLHMPFQVGDYTDFYASRSHATNVGSMFRSKENALMPNW